MTDIITRLRQLDTCAVSDALDRLGHTGALLGIGPMSVRGRPVAGRVSTVHVVERTDDRPRPHLGSAAIEAGDEETILVVSSGGRLDVSAWGGILSRAAQQRGIAGAIVDGACRDVDEAAHIGFPVFARAAVPVTARGRIVERATDVPLRIGSQTVEPGDVAIADGSGVVVCPRTLIEEMLVTAESIAAREQRMAEDVAAGSPISEVMHDTRFEASAEPR
jgi:regulator of RNase E activity RraA